jgi:hypothetical protein
MVYHVGGSLASGLAGAADGAVGDVLGSVAVCGFEGLGYIHFEGDLIGGGGLGGKFALAAQRFGYVVDKKHSLGAGDRHRCLLRRKRLMLNYAAGDEVDLKKFR